MHVSGAAWVINFFILRTFYFCGLAREISVFLSSPDESFPSQGGQQNQQRADP
jgi:hypothetical protein